jgi:hypothetical protein
MKMNTLINANATACGPINNNIRNTERQIKNVNVVVILHTRWI